MRASEKKVSLAGWVDSVRDKGKIVFIILRDRSGRAQVVVKDKKLIETAKKLLREYVISVEGAVRKSQSTDFPLELEASSIVILNKAEAPLPLDPNVESELETRLHHRYMDIRNPKVAAIFRIQDIIQRSFVRYLEEQGFILVNVPCIVAAATEGGTDLFPVKYFSHNVYLSQSPQLYKQMLMASGLDKVIIQAPVFRAEQHNTTRHLNESTQMDIEIAFVEDEQTALECIGNVLQYIYSSIKKEGKASLEILEPLKTPKFPVKQITYTQALEILKKDGIDITWGNDLTPEAERMLCSRYELVIITKWPTDIRAFYSMPEPGRPEICRAYDMLLGGIEVLSGAQRIHKYEDLVNEMKRRGMNPSDFSFYLDAFRYGMPPHAGWSFGLQRLTMAILGLKNIREACIFPRDRTRVEP
jgi:aspartyl-tRNA synthetase